MLVGNNDGLLGVNIDIKNYYNFFISPTGGAWRNDEICELKNITKEKFRRIIDSIRSEELDYFIFIFSGHGGSQRQDTVLELSNNEYVLETEIDGIANRQLSIYDCCRCSGELLQENRIRNEIEASGGLYYYNSCRRFYESKISEAINQHIKLYACRIGETAEDTGDGGVFSHSFIKNAKNVSLNKTKYVSTAFCDTVSDLRNGGYAQNPDSRFPRCLTSQQLIISINPCFSVMHEDL